MVAAIFVVVSTSLEGVSVSIDRLFGRFTGVLVLAGCLFGLPAMAQGSAVITGRVVDAASKAPIADVVVTATSPALQGEQIVVTDATGTYRIPQLPAGQYTLRLEKEAYKPYARSDISLRTDRTTRVNVELLPEALTGEEIVVVGAAPTIDVGSSSTGVNVGSEFINNIAVVRPGGKGSATRSFESLAEIAPGAHSDAYGVSINGTTSPENNYVIDGLSVNDPGYGILGTPLTVEFVKEVNVITGGYMPEYGRATGGIMNVVTKTGSNEFHGSVWGNFTPGSLQGDSPVIQREGSVIYNDIELWNQGDFGAELGGPILKDKLWFYAGFAPAFSRESIDRHFYRQVACTADDFASGAAGCDNDPSDPEGATNYLRRTETGGTEVSELEGARRQFFADQRTFQYIGKLTYLINQDHNLTLSVYGAPTSSGGEGKFGFDAQDGFVEIGSTTAGDITAIGHRYVANSNDVALKYSGAFADKRILLDVTGGWHHQESSRLPSDGSTLGTTEGLAGTPMIHYRRTQAKNAAGVITRDYHSLAEFQDFEGEDQCNATVTLADGSTTSFTTCPVTAYFQGGPDFIQQAFLDRYQGKAVATYLLNAAGHHVIKAGVDAEQMVYENNKGYGGLLRWRETTTGTAWDTIRMYGYMTAPNEAIIQRNQIAKSTSNTIGGFVQDSWSVLDLFTINAGVRYDQQTLIGDDNEVGLRLGNQWSPRVGVIYDFTQEGRSKIFANYARFYESVPLDLVDRQFPGERTLFARYRAQRTAADGSEIPGCDPTTESPEGTSDCSVGTETDGSLRSTPQEFRLALDPYSPNPDFIVVGGEKSAVDPDLKPQSSDEIVVGAEYEVLPDARVGASYTKRYMNHVIEDMSRDEANTYFIGNPGFGIAKDFPEATRNYDAVTVYFNKTFSDLWLGQLSYTWSKLEGNYAGLFRPETGQLDPNINSDFDLISLLDNRTGPLPGDRTHSVKAFGAKEFVLTGAMSVNLGLSYRARSGSPLNYFGSHAVYGSDEVFILPRGSGGRLPWRHDIDAHLGYNLKLSKDNVVTVSVDVFNLFNFQGVVAQDQRYTSADVLPIPAETTGTNDEKLTRLVYADDGSPFEASDINPNFKNVTAYQAPRIMRFGAKVTF